MNPYGPDPITEARPVALDGGPQPGAHVWIEWRGSWWPGTVVRLAGHGLYRVHYTGWGEPWDETVGLHRLAPYDRPPPGRKASSGGGCVGAAVGLVAMCLVGVGLAIAFSAPSGPSAQDAAPIASIDELRVAEPVWIAWGDGWFEGEVLAIDAAHGLVHVHYDGWDASSDEDVTLDRLRVR